MEKQICAFCGRWYDIEAMISLHEDGKTFVLYYCEGCFPAVKSNVASLPYSHLFKWGKRGIDNEK